jgi:hypothetical protein
MKPSAKLKPVKLTDARIEAYRDNVEKLGKLMLPKFSKWTLAEMSRNPEAISQWHRDVAKTNGRSSADKAAKVIRALYRRERKGSRVLPPDDPCSAVKYGKAVPAQTAMPFEAHPGWRMAWEAMGSPIQKAFAWGAAGRASRAVMGRCAAI